MVILHEVSMNARHFGKSPFVVTLKEKSPLVTEHSWLKDKDIWNVRMNHPHQNSRSPNNSSR